MFVSLIYFLKQIIKDGSITIKFSVYLKITLGTAVALLGSFSPIVKQWASTYNVCYYNQDDKYLNL